MYTTGQAAIRDGLRIATTRAWERRYGVVDVERTEAGDRLNDDVQRLIRERP